MNQFLHMMVAGLLCLLCTLAACSAPQPRLRTLERLDPAARDRAIEVATNPAAFEKLLEEYTALTPSAFASLPEFTPDVIRNVFDGNQEIADDLYGEKWMKVRGTLFYGPFSESSRFAMHYVGLERKGKVMAFLFYTDKDAELLSKLKHGQELVIAGLYVPGEKHHPKLIGCRLIEVDHEPVW